MSEIMTYTKKMFDPLQPNAELIDIEDIAHALSMLCRANGHFKSFYSVAQHSINCMKEAKARGYSDRIQLACLLHDASEAYLSDVTRPVKAELPRYKEIEAPLQELIWNKWLGEPLTEEERKQMPMGAKLMTLECGVRFLTDYLDGDNYFSTSYEGQNLDRCRTQLKLVADMETKWDQMHAIIASL